MLSIAPDVPFVSGITILKAIFLRLGNSLKNRSKLRQHFIHDCWWQGVDLARMACVKIKHAGLVTANNTSCLNACYRNGKSDAAREVTSACDRTDHRQSGCFIELGRRYDQDRTASALFMPCSRIKRDQINVAPLQINSPPAAGASSHSRSSAGCGCE